MILENKIIESADFVSIDPTNYATFSSNYIFLFYQFAARLIHSQTNIVKYSHQTQKTSAEL